MAGFTKMFEAMLTSSVWMLDMPTRIVWVALLLASDADGYVEGSVAGFAHKARVTVEEMRAAIEILASPDPDSRTPDHEGRRIEAVDGGWVILNHPKYRLQGQAKEGSRAPYHREWRRKQREKAFSEDGPAGREPGQEG